MNEIFIQRMSFRLSSLFISRELFFVPIIMSIVSFFSYQPTLFGVEPVSIGLLAFGVLILIIILAP